MKPKYTVAQLIEKLKKFSPELPVITSGNVFEAVLISLEFRPYNL